MFEVGKGVFGDPFRNVGVALGEVVFADFAETLALELEDGLAWFDRGWCGHHLVVRCTSCTGRSRFLHFHVRNGHDVARWISSVAVNPDDGLFARICRSLSALLDRSKSS